MFYSRSRNSSTGSERLSQDIAKLVNDRYGSDVQFMVGGGAADKIKSSGEMITSAAVAMYAHSAILRCRSRHFAAMFENDKEWRNRSDGVIYKPNISVTVFHKVLEYIYTGDVHIEMDTLLDLIAAAEEMELEELSIKCQVTVMQVLEQALSNEENKYWSYEKRKEESYQYSLSIDFALRKFLFPALTLAHSHTLTDFFRRLSDFTIRNINIILASPDFRTTFYEEIPTSIFRQVLASDALDMPEHKVWEFAFGLACHKTKVLESAVEAHFRYGFESGSDNDDDFESPDFETEFEDSHDDCEWQALISEEQLKQLKVNLTPLLPAIRLSLIGGDQYSRIAEILSYFLPSRRVHELNRFYAQSDKTLPLDIPRLNRRHEPTSNTKEFEELLQTFSDIINKVELWQQIKTWIFESNEIKECYSAKEVKLNLLFRASEHEFRGEAFHKLCDNKGPTLVIVKSDNGHLFGGINFAHWESNNTYSGTTSNFLFALADGQHRKISSNFLYSSNGDNINAVYNNPYRGPIFGNGACDLYITDRANISKSSSYMPKLYNGVGASNCALAGKEDFLIIEYEVFAISKS